MKIQVENADGNSDLFPPERITNLKAIPEENGTIIVVKFTATGEDLDDGTARYLVMHNILVPDIPRSKTESGNMLTDN